MKKWMSASLGLVCFMALTSAWPEGFNAGGLSGSIVPAVPENGAGGDLFASASRTGHGASVPEGDGAAPEAEYPLGRDRWIRFYSGYDFAFLDEFVNGTNNYYAYLESNGATNIGISSGRGGILYGLEAGQRLDADDALSVSAELVLTQPARYYADLSGTHNSAEMGPSLLSASLNYQRTLLRGSGLRTFASVGAGYYHAMLNMEGSGTGSTDLQYQTVLTGDILGATAALGEEFALGSWISLELTARFRAADFSRVTGDLVTLSGTSTTNIGNKPYTLFTGPGINNVLELASTSYIGTPGTHPMALDYSGFDGELSVKMSF